MGMTKLAGIVGAVVSLGVGCEVAELPGGQPDARDTRDTRDTAAEVEADARDLVSCDPFAIDSPCEEGQYCETTARVCVECVGFIQRCVGSPERATRETCEQPRASGVGELEGGFYEPDPCASGEVCVASGQIGGPVSCRPRVCEPGYATCLSPTRVEACNASGTEEVEETCGAGEACYSGRCEQLRHNVLLVFDTSASMWSYLEPSWNLNHSPLRCEENPHPCFSEFPVCDDVAAPLSLFTLSKNVFSTVVSDAIGSFSQFALMRFPQRETPGLSPSCANGWYVAQDVVTGDDDARATDAATWFEDHLGEVLAVPFPVRTTIDNTPDLLSWIDHEERLAASLETCVDAADCGEGGRCGDYNGERRCFYHSDPELRAISQTPLGKSLFYAGEYFRRFVRVDGKACSVDSDCDSAGYLCRDAKCVDPYRKCKDDFIVLFTDGGESFFQQETEFFNPVVQAKRLAYGLDCQDDSDCRGGATCIADKCIGKDQTTLDTPSVSGEGYGALATPDGTPISIKTTVITVNATPSINARIAYAGGGTNVEAIGLYEGSEDERKAKVAALVAALKSAMTPNYKCRPEDIE